MTAPLIDQAARSQAIEDAATPLVVTAGAGTGKTTLLVDRILELALGRGVPLREIVALTFTQKAANEMRIRVLAMLQRTMAVLEGRERSATVRDEIERRVEGWMARYRLKRDTVLERARAATGDLDRTLIETLHGFASYVLRLYPVQARVDPDFQVDPGERCDDLFEREWERWIEGELAEGAARAEEWLPVLQQVPLDALEQAARRLAGFDVPPDVLAAGGEAPGTRERLAAAVGAILDEIARVQGRRTKGIKLAERLDAFADALRGWREERADWNAGLREALADSRLEPGKAWSPQDGAAARAIAQTARTLLRNLIEADPALIARVVGLLAPFALSFRRTFLQAGLLSFDALLVLVRDLVRDRLDVREELKRAFSALLVDEFQDTDPVQYEVLFYLAERPGGTARELRDVRLEPGKLFIVGDPKQSIYAFRRADIEAFEEVRSQVRDQGGALLDLQANFRSHGGITRAVNAVFRRLIRPFKRLQPEYRDIHAQREPEDGDAGVELVRVAPAKEGEKMLAEPARRAQAELLAQWVIDAVGVRTVPGDVPGSRRPLRHRDVAVLFRSLSSVHVYLEAFRRARIPYVVEGEKYFYSNQEILDFVNLLRAIENPHDAVALVGFLRSAYGGLTDGEIHRLIEAGRLDYRLALPPDAPGGDRLARLYADLAELHAGLGRRPLDALLADILARTFFLEVTAGSYQGEQKLANLLKLRRMALEMGREGDATLRRFIAVVQARIEDETEEGESPLADETLDAVKILSVHKAKGLEFPVVVLANLHAERPHGRRGECRVVYDWTERVVGIDLHGVRNLGSVLLAGKEEERQAEEEKRVLYVAMTRARERLILLGSADLRGDSGQAQVQEALGVDGDAEGDVTIDDASVRCRTFRWDGTRIAPAPAPPEAAERLPSWNEFAATWAQRRSRGAAIAEGRDPEDDPEAKRAKRLGTVCHRVLETLDFAAAERDLEAALARACIGLDGAAEAAEDARAILRAFVRSAAFAELRDAEVLGREIPLLVRDPLGGEPVERSLDVLYRAGPRLVVGDYKTDRIDPGDASERAASHAAQGRAYVEALAGVLGGTVPEFRVFFLRTGQAVNVDVSGGEKPGAPGPRGEPVRRKPRRR